MPPFFVPLHPLRKPGIRRLAEVLEALGTDERDQRSVELRRSAVTESSAPPTLAVDLWACSTPTGVGGELMVSSQRRAHRSAEILSHVASSAVLRRLSVSSPLRRHGRHGPARLLSPELGLLSARLLSARLLSSSPDAEDGPSADALLDLLVVLSRSSARLCLLACTLITALA